MSGGITKHTRGELDVLIERRRQQMVEGYRAAHDDEHTDGSLATAAACYASVAGCNTARGMGAKHWPWSIDSFKPRDERSNLVRAGALILAEIERLDRAAAKASDA